MSTSLLQELIKKKEISKNIDYLKTINQFNLINIYRTRNPTTAEHTHSS